MNKEERYAVCQISWEQLQSDARTLAWRLLEKGPFQNIVAVTRGGLIPASIVARELGIRNIETACVMLYDHKETGEMETDEYGLRYEQFEREQITLECVEV